MKLAATTSRAEFTCEGTTRLAIPVPAFAETELAKSRDIPTNFALQAPSTLKIQRNETHALKKVKWFHHNCLAAPPDCLAFVWPELSSRFPLAPSPLGLIVWCSSAVFFCSALITTWGNLVLNPLNARVPYQPLK